jgi:hypothetical protein
MPTIIVTNEQKRAYEAGEPITKPEPKRYIAVGKGPQAGAVYLIIEGVPTSGGGLRGQGVLLLASGSNRAAGESAPITGEWIGSAFDFTEDTR